MVSLQFLILSRSLAIDRGKLVNIYLFLAIESCKYIAFYLTLLLNNLRKILLKIRNKVFVNKTLRQFCKNSDDFSMFSSRHHQVKR